jgi:nucleotide-binding universal stress UspA family protein
MSYKTILVHSQPDAASDPAINLALTVAGMFQAAILGVGAEAFEPATYGYMDGNLLAAAANQVDVDLTLAERRFRERTGDARHGADWVSSRGYPLDVMALHGRGADLVVAARPARHVSEATGCTPAGLLMATGLPLLLAPRSGVELDAKRIVVAWANRREANRAISDAMPFLMRAEAVHVVNVCPTDEHDETGLVEVKRRLARHGVAVEAETLSRVHPSMTGDLQAAADRHGADMIVTGGYGHSRMREWVLGGVTEEFLAFSSKYILLSR